MFIFHQIFEINSNFLLKIPEEHFTAMLQTIERIHNRFDISVAYFQAMIIFIVFFVVINLKNMKNIQNLVTNSKKICVVLLLAVFTPLMTIFCISITLLCPSIFLLLRNMNSRDQVLFYFYIYNLSFLILFFFLLN